MFQTTIKRRITCEGIGLHSGKTVRISLNPAAEDTGIIFQVDGPAGSGTVTASPDAVIATELATTLGAGQTRVSTVEHLLAALRGLEIDNLRVHVHGTEIPILDGSAEPFVNMILESGISVQAKTRRVYRFTRPFETAREGKSITALPYNGFRVDYTIDFAHPAIGTQRRILELSPSAFSEVAMARTFGFLQDVEYLQQKGQALGGSLDNAVVLDRNGVINPDGLRAADEFVRHKILDFIGDMAMLDHPLQGSFTVVCSGHSLNNEFLRGAVSGGLLRLEDTGTEYLPLVSPSSRRRPSINPVQAPALAAG